MRVAILGRKRARRQALCALAISAGAMWFALGGMLPARIFAADPPPRETPQLNQPWPPSPTDRIVNIAGVYPHLAVFNSAGECGIGAIAAWNDKLWLITYPPHFPDGSDDKLYSIDAELRRESRPESVGGTHANRMIHDATKTLIIGPYFIDAQGGVRVADLKQLRARLTATTPHLTDPRKVFFLGMERELFEVDVQTLTARKIYGEMEGLFPGYHGKGARVTGGRLVVANNGEKNWDIRRDPHFNGPAGGLAETDGKDWARPFDVIARANFTEVTGPGGIHSSSDDGRVWALGWDKRSVILALREHDQWRNFRLPKGSYTHDALHGWFTEWPRIREVGGGKWLMHMHGLFYDFPPGFGAHDTRPPRPLATYLKMPVDYCAWQNQIVMACDDASVMQNPLAGQSHSNLRFLKWDDIASYGAPSGWGGVWLDDNVVAGQTSEPFLVAGFREGTLHIRHHTDARVNFRIETDSSGQGDWKEIGAVATGPRGYAWHILNADLPASWIRLTPDRAADRVTAFLHLSNPPRGAEPKRFHALVDMTQPPPSPCVIKPAEGDARTLLVAVPDGPEGKNALLKIDGRLVMENSGDPKRAAIMFDKFGPKTPAYTEDAASLIVDDGGTRFRLPRTPGIGRRKNAEFAPRDLREVVTERSLFNAGGSFYEVPRAGSGGWRRMRPITTHNKWISDFCSWRGMLVLARADPDASESDGARLVSCNDTNARAAVWLGDVDELWVMGAPRGTGGPWLATHVTANIPSDPFLMAGYQKKSLRISHDAAAPVVFRVEVDFLADNSWSEYARFRVEPHTEFVHDFPAGYSAHWVRLVAETTVTATATFVYAAP
jgi:hypothetical protein